jgi:hypothetical protein
MELLELPGWSIEYDRLTTIASYKLASANRPEQCDCDPCHNWVATRDRLFPKGFLDLLNQLGISFDCEAEVYHNCGLESGLHSYGAWYHFIGRVIYGEHECSPLIVLGPFSVYFHSKPALVPGSFAGQPVVQLEVVAEVPWLSDVPEAS